MTFNMSPSKRICNRSPQGKIGNNPENGPRGRPKGRWQVVRTKQCSKSCSDNDIRNPDTGRVLEWTRRSCCEASDRCATAGSFVCNLLMFVSFSFVQLHTASNL